MAMDSETLEALARDIEIEEPMGEDERVLSAADILPILETLDERGVDLTFALAEIA